VTDPVPCLVMVQPSRSCRRLRIRVAIATFGVAMVKELRAPLPEGEPPPASVDLRERSARVDLSAMLVRLFDHWGLKPAEQAGVLGLSPANRASLARYRHGEPLADNRDLLDRASALLGIHKALRIIFPQDRDLAYRWMTTFNRRFGARPVDLVVDRGFEGLLALRRYLEFERGR